MLNEDRKCSAGELVVEFPQTCPNIKNAGGGLLVSAVVNCPFGGGGGRCCRALHKKRHYTLNQKKKYGI